MDEIHRKTLQTLRLYLVDNLIVSPRFLDVLRSSDILLRDHYERIVAKTCSSDKITYLLDYLACKGPDSYAALTEALRETSQEFIIDALVAKEVELRSGNAPLLLDPINFAQPVTSTDSSEPLARYEVSSIPRGIVLIVNNYHFTVDNLEDRTGSNLDVDMLQALFEELDYSVEEPACDLTADQMCTAVRNFSKLKRLHEVSVCVLVLMSHGGRDTIFGTDGKAVNLYDLFNLFNSENCRPLSGKPKLFIVQACRGKKQDCPGTVHVDSPAFDGSLGSAQEEFPSRAMDQEVLNDNHDSLDAGSGGIDHRQQQHNLPAACDRLIAYASTPGYEALRHSTEGSWFVQALCPVFRQYAGSLSVLDMLTKVNQVVTMTPSFSGESSRKMMPGHEGSLMKAFFL